MPRFTHVRLGPRVLVHSTLGTAPIFPEFIIAQPLHFPLLGNNDLFGWLGGVKMVDNGIGRVGGKNQQWVEEEEEERGRGRGKGTLKEQKGSSCGH